MADLTVGTVKQVGTGTGTLERSYLCGETLTAGQSVYLNGASPAKWLKAQADGTGVEAGSNGYGIILHGGALDQPAVVAKAGTTVDMGVAVADGELYVISATAGLIAQIGDLASGDFTTILGYGNANANELVMVNLLVPTERIAAIT